MSTEVHPGYCNPEVSFSEFEPFIKLGDLPETQKVKFINFLQAIFDKTRKIWMPTACRGLAVMEDEVQQIARKSEFIGIKIEPRSFCGDTHFWWVYKQGDKELIIDPTGVLPEGADEYEDTELIVPFFGDKELAKGFAKQVYEEGLPLGPRGYHIFHP